MSPLGRLSHFRGCCALSGLVGSLREARSVSASRSRSETVSSFAEPCTFREKFLLLDQDEDAEDAAETSRRFAQHAPRLTARLTQQSKLCCILRSSKLVMQAEAPKLNVSYFDA